MAERRTQTLASEHWAHRLPGDIRGRLNELHRVEPWRHLKIPLLFAIWLGTAMVAVWSNSLWVSLPCALLIGLCLHGLGVFMHEGAHHNLFRRRLLDRFIGFTCGLPVLISCSNYRATHVLHHRHENTAADPDNMAARFRSGLLRRLVYYSWYAVGMPVYAVVLAATGPFRAEGWREKMACAAESALLIGFYSGLVWATVRFGFSDVLWSSWGGGLIVASLIANVRGLAEHTMLPQDDPPNPLRTTRSTPSSAVISFFFNNQNYHLEHHLFPRVPWYNLPAVHQLLRPFYRREQAAVCRGYREYLSDAFRHGPMRELRYGPEGRSMPT